MLPADVPVRLARAAFADDHVAMLLLVEGGHLRGTLVREDLPPGAAPTAPVSRWARTAGRTVLPAESLGAVRRRLVAAGQRRLAVVDEQGTLLGLLCLKRSRTGFCSDAGVAARARGGRRAASSPADPEARDPRAATWN